MLQVKDLSVNFCSFSAVRNVCLSVSRSEAVALIGRNGAGKTSLARGIVGLHDYSGSVHILAQAGEIISLKGLRPWIIAQAGVIYVPEIRSTFEGLSVQENLRVGPAALGIHDGRVADLLADVYSTFPVLETRKQQTAGSLSGGERKLLAIGRALALGLALRREKLQEFVVLVVDEPTHGLHPSASRSLLEAFNRLTLQGFALLILEQEEGFALRAGSRVYVMRNGAIVHSGTSASLSRSDVEALV
ncbi:MAG: branched-chain amino acid transport system ATP-binding protein [Acidobacteriota bacterium]|jgi:branched-chain amino acid transport system ATP-binding protein|nr:branched-chain amino acid transport system ATP-binding protein [Acidobacteriota bacterium]